MGIVFDKEKFYKGIEASMGLLFFCFGLFFLNEVNTYTGDMSIFYQIILGLLVFIGIFYPLVIKSDWKRKRDKIMMSTWKEFYKNSLGNLKKTDTLVSKKEIDKAAEVFGSIPEKFNIFTLEFDKLRIENHFKNAVFSLIIALILSLGLLFLSSPYYIYTTNISITLITFIFLLYGIYKIVQFLIVWNKIYKL